MTAIGKRPDVGQGPPAGDAVPSERLCRQARSGRSFPTRHNDFNGRNPVRKTVSIIAISAALALGACGPKAEKSEDAASNSVDNAADTAGAVIANAADNVKEAVLPTPTGQEFIDKAAKSDAFEIASAKLAKEKADSADIKAFAKMMTTDHTGSTAKIKAAAAAASPALKPDPTLTDDQQGKLADLGKLTGKDFDKAYADQQIAAHKSALSLMKLYADKGDVTTLKAAAGDIVPKVQAHLDKIEAIKAAL
jgi:putative membrane protein